MREILFRGKRIDNGAWVEGAFCLKDCDSPFGEMVDRPSIIKYEPPCDGFWFRVEPETVGQFTGLTDKNGKKIFEGDIVEGHCHSQWRHDLQRCEIAYGRDGFEARHHVKQGNVQRYYSYKVLFSKDVVVIGNIHDNPELAEGGSEDGK